MAKTLSQDLRCRLIGAVEGGISRRAAAERFKVGIATAIRWVREFRTTGATAAKPKGGDRRSHRIEAYRDTILGDRRLHVRGCALRDFGKADVRGAVPLR